MSGKKKSSAWMEMAKVLKGFEKDKLFEVVVPHLKVASETAIVNEICRLKLKCNTASIVQVLLNFLKQSETEEDIKKHLPMCYLLKISCMPEKQNWTCIRFKRKEEAELDDDVMTSKNLEVELKRSLMRNDVRADVNVIFKNSIFWCSISEKKLVKKVFRSLPPVFFALHYKQPFVFWCQRKPSMSVLQAAAEVNGYESFGTAHLTGHDIESMVNLLLHKNQRPGANRKVQLSSTVTEEPSGVDFSQQANRVKFMEDLYGPNPPKVSNFSVEARNVPWQGKYPFTMMETITTTSRLVFHTNDTVQLFKVLAEERVLRIPPPTYAQNILDIGKNSLKLRAPGNKSQSEIE